MATASFDNWGNFHTPNVGSIAPATIPGPNQAQAAPATAPSSGLTNIWSGLQTQFGPTAAANRSNFNSNYWGQIADIANLGHQADQFRNQYSTGIAKIGLDRQGNAIDIGNANQNLGIYGQMRDINDLQKQYANEDLANTQKFAAQSLANFLAQNNLATRQATQHQLSAGIAGGGGMTGGQTIGLSQIGTEGRQKAQAQEISTAERLAQALVQNKQFLSQQDMANLRLTQSENSEKANIAKLNLASSSLGIDRSDLDKTLQAGLDKTGLAQFVSANQLKDMLTSNDAQQQALAGQMLQEFVKQAQASGASAADIEAFRQSPDFNRYLATINPNRSVFAAVNPGG